MGDYADFRPSTRFVESLEISPDGRHLAYVDDRHGQFGASVVGSRGGIPRRITTPDDLSLSSVRWYPDGGALLLEADTEGDEMIQMYRAEPGGGRPEPLATGERRSRVMYGLGPPFSPDGRRLLYLAGDRSSPDHDMFVRDLATGAETRVYAEGGHAYPGHWSPDGKRANAVELIDGLSEHVLYLVSADGSPPVRLTGPGPAAMYWPGPCLPDGSGFLVRSNAGRDHAGLAVVDAGNGALSWYDALPWDVEDVALSGDGRILVWSVNVAGASKLRARDLATGADLAVPDLPPGVAAALDVSATGDFAVLLFSTPTTPDNILRVDLRTGEVRWLTDCRPVAADPAAFVEPRLIHYPAPDGREIPAYLYRPRSRAGRGPVVLAVHGGPASQERPSYSNDGFFQFLLAHGVAVLAPNIRGSSGYGMPYQRLNYRDWGGGGLQDLAAAAAFLQAQDWVDPGRIGLVGRSYGGFMVLSCVSRLPEVDWAAAVAWCGPGNLLTFARNQPATWRGAVEAQIGDPEADADLLLARSPMTYADQVRAPLMVIQGARDFRVPKEESDQMVARLRDRGIDVRYDVYPDEGHRFGKRKNQIEAQSSAGTFLLEHLGRAPGQ